MDDRKFYLTDYIQFEQYIGEHQEAIFQQSFRNDKQQILWFIVIIMFSKSLKHQSDGITLCFKSQRVPIALDL